MFGTMHEDKEKTQMVKKDIVAGIITTVLAIAVTVTGIVLCGSKFVKHEDGTAGLEYWTEGSPNAQSIISYVAAVTDEESAMYVPPEHRVAVFDVDGTLIGELFPTYFDQCLMLHRFLHDNTYEAKPEDKEYCQALETALINHEELPKAPRSSGQMIAESFKGFTPDEYRAYIRDFLETPANGFEGMTYGEGFYKPMVSVVEYLAGHDFRIFLVSGGERTMVREVTEDTLGKWVSPYHIIGSTVSLEATGLGDTEARKYTYTVEDEVLLEGNMLFKNDRWNKVVSIVNEIGDIPVIAFGNSTGDLSMGQYTVEHGGKAYMLLCDDTERDYGRPDVAEEFRHECEVFGFNTVSMKNEFATIYGDNVIKTDFSAELAPAA